MIITQDIEDRARKIGMQRTNLHNKTPSAKTGMNDDYDDDYLGALGEICFEEMYGYPVDEEDRIQGDDGTDFIIKCLHDDVISYHSVDIKTSSQKGESYDHLNLLVPIDKVESKIYVQAMYREHKRCIQLVGWETAQSVKKAPIKKKKKTNHEIKIPNLRPMSELEKKMLRG